MVRHGIFCFWKVVYQQASEGRDCRYEQKFGPGKTVCGTAAVHVRHTVMEEQSRVAVSVVSHGQAGLVKTLLEDLHQHCTTPLDVLLTLNCEEKLPFQPREFRFPLQVIMNERPKGFAANHNAAFAQTNATYFSVLNPDIRIRRDPFPHLLQELVSQSVGVVAPLILSPMGEQEDSIRRFPTPWSILRKLTIGPDGPDYIRHSDLLNPDWIAGMFMVFRGEVFREMRGFDEKYFLYYEDVDLCWRLRLSGYRIAVVPSASVVHAAQRTSHANVRYLRWHVASMMRYFLKRLRSFFNLRATE